MSKGPEPEANPRIERATPADYAAIVDLLRSCGLPAGDLSADGISGFLVARHSATLAGVAGLEQHGSHGLLRSLAVQPAFRKSGLGSELVAAIEAQAAQTGTRDLYLLTETAERFFRARGYATVPRSSVPGPIAACSEFGTLCPSSALVMRRSIADLK